MDRLASLNEDECSQMVDVVYRLTQELAIYSSSVIIGIISLLTGKPIKSKTVAICGQCLWRVRTLVQYHMTYHARHLVNIPGSYSS